MTLVQFAEIVKVPVVSPVLNAMLMFSPQHLAQQRAVTETYTKIYVVKIFSS